MEKLNNPAILVVDMLNDFVTGALTCDRAKAIVPATAELLDAARKAGVPVIFCNDAHIAGIDRELKIWGDHAIAGTKGAEVIPELKLSDKDYVVPKRRYSGFFQTDLDILLRELGVDEVFIDKASGKNADRPELTRMMNYVRRGDTVIVESISRFARNTRDLLDLVERLTEKQVEFVSRKEAIDTTTPTGKFMLTVFAAVAELEREYILQRQREGIAIAKKQGKYTGRKPRPLPDNFERVVARWRAGEITAAEAMRQTGLKANTFYRRCSQTSLALKRIKSI